MNYSVYSSVIGKIFYSEAKDFFASLLFLLTFVSFYYVPETGQDAFIFVISLYFMV